MARPRSLYRVPGNSRFYDLAYAVSVVYPWTTFPVSIEQFADDVFKYMKPDAELYHTADDPKGVLARFLEEFFRIETRLGSRDGEPCMTYVLPEAPQARDVLVKHLQIARDRTMY